MHAAAALTVKCGMLQHVLHEIAYTYMLFIYGVYVCLAAQKKRLFPSTPIHLPWLAFNGGRQLRPCMRMRNTCSASFAPTKCTCCSCMWQRLISIRASCN